MLELPPGEEPEPAGGPQKDPLPGLRLDSGRGWGWPVLAGAASGLLAWLAFPPADLGYLAFAGLVPLVLVWRSERVSGPQAAGAAGAFGLVFFGALLPWIRLFGFPAYIALVLMESVIMALGLSAGRGLAGEWGRRWRAFGFPVVFLATEFVRAHVPFGGFSWGGLGYSQHNHAAFLRIAPLAGIWGLTLAVAGVNALLAGAVVAATRRRWRAAAMVAAAGALVALPGLAPPPGESSGGHTAAVAVVQGSAPENIGNLHPADDELFDNHLRVTAGITSRPDLVVWPESAVSVPIDDPFYKARLEEAIRRTGAWFLAGTTLDLPDGRFANATIFFRPDGSQAGSYYKQHLVPFGEYVPPPFRSLLTPFIKELERVPRDAVAGRSAKVFSIPQGRLATLICYESTFPELVRRSVRKGARLLVVSTNNSSYRRSAASRQHVAFSQVRAAEEGMWVVHAALTGISTIVDPSGRVHGRTGLFTPALLTHRVGFEARTTAYARFGDWLAFAALAAAAGGAVSTLIWHRKAGDER